MIYRVTLHGYFALHTADSALADAWKNHFGGTVEQIHLGDIKSVSAEMWDGSELSATRIALDRVRAMMREKERQMEEMYKELCAWRGAFVKQNGLAYDQERDAIVHMDTWTPYRDACLLYTSDAADEDCLV